MKQFGIFLNLFILLQTVAGQVSGNINYQRQVRFPDSHINVKFQSNNDIVFSVKGLNNVKADAYIAIFNVTQVGKTTQEVNQLITKRIDAVLKYLGDKPDVSSYTDMISFVPVYEYEIQKKIFTVEMTGFCSSFFYSFINKIIN